MEMMLAFAMADLWGDWLGPVLMLLVGLGLVIFVHELGHFLVAKAVGIKVEKFSLGFGPKLLSLTRGETEYQLAALPLGGYVKMLGQEDFKPTDEQQRDPRAYNNKPVWARMAVVSAGVVMNVIFAAILFIVVCLAGIDFPDRIVGGVGPGMPAATCPIDWDQPMPAALADMAPPPNFPPAATAPASGAATSSFPATADTPATASAPASGSAPATGPEVEIVWDAASGPASYIQTFGLEEGDKVLSINGKPITRWHNILLRAAMAREDEIFDMRIERVIDGKTYTGTAHVGVAFGSENLLAFGIAPPAETVIAPKDPEFIGISPWQEDDRMVSVNWTENGKVVSHPVQFDWDLKRLADQAPWGGLSLSVLHKGQSTPTTMPVEPEIVGGAIYRYDLQEKKYGDKLSAIITARTPNWLVLKYSDDRSETVRRDLISLRKDKENSLTILGMTPRVKIATVKKDDPADRAGIKPGDIVVSYGGKTPPTIKETYDVTENFAGKGASITVLRGEQAISLEVTPRQDKDRTVIGVGLGLDMEHPVVAGVESGSAAAKAKIEAGDVIVKVNDTAVQNWQDVFRCLLAARDKEVSLTVRRNAKMPTLFVGKLTPQVFDPMSYQKILVPGRGLDVAFKTFDTRIHQTNPAKAISWGLEETYDFLVGTYAQIRGLATRTIPASELRGPLGIGAIAIKTGRRGLTYFIYLMAIISVSLAVINFLPIPVVDGGHMVFLAIEKIMGKPLSINAQNWAQRIGLALLLALFLWATGSDIFRFIAGKW